MVCDRLCDANWEQQQSDGSRRLRFVSYNKKITILFSNYNVFRIRIVQIAYQFIHGNSLLSLSSIFSPGIDISVLCIAA